MGIDYLDVATLGKTISMLFIRLVGAVAIKPMEQPTQTIDFLHTAFVIRPLPPPHPPATAPVPLFGLSPLPLHSTPEARDGCVCPLLQEKFRSWSLFFWFVCRPAAQLPPYQDFLEHPLPRNCQRPNTRAENDRTTEWWSQFVVIENLIRVSTAAHAA